MAGPIHFPKGNEEPKAAGLSGTAPGSGPGVQGIGKDGPGVRGHSASGPGVSATSDLGPGLSASSTAGNGVESEALVPAGHAIAAYQRYSFPTAPEPIATTLALAGAAIYSECRSGYAANFVGKVNVTGDILAPNVMLTGQDCAEHFNTAEVGTVEAGTVMVLGEEGSLQRSHKAYDKRVAGIVSGAGEYRPGLILGRPNHQHTKLIALSGKVFCRVDAEYGTIAVGDLLTTSDTPGHAMKADDPVKAFGTVIGKAMSALDNGQGLIPVLVGLL